jgi:hypothetical protein
MSSGIYVLKTKDGYRVNFSDRYYDFFGGYDDSTGDYAINAETIEEVFGFCQVIQDETEAIKKAISISNKLTFETFDGIMIIDNYQNMTFEELINGKA